MAKKIYLPTDMPKHSRRRSARDDEDEKGKKLPRSALIGGGVAGALILIAIVYFFILPGNKEGGVFDRDVTAAQQRQQDQLQKMMQDEVDKATARGASKDELDRIRKSYQMSLSGLK